MCVRACMCVCSNITDDEAITHLAGKE